MQSLQDHFLIAMPAMADPNFNETVTYICKHDADGRVRHHHQSAERHVARRNVRAAGIELKDRSARGAARDARRPRRARARLRAAPVGQRRSMPRSPSAPRSADVVAGHPRGHRPRRRPRSRRSSRSATRAGVAASSRPSSAATPGSPCRRIPRSSSKRRSSSVGLPRSACPASTFSASRSMPVTPSAHGWPAWRSASDRHILARIRLRSSSYRRRYREPRDAHGVAADDAARRARDAVARARPRHRRLASGAARRRRSRRRRRARSSRGARALSPRALAERYALPVATVDETLTSAAAAVRARGEPPVRISSPPRRQGRRRPRRGVPDRGAMDEPAVRDGSELRAKSRQRVPRGRADPRAARLAGAAVRVARARAARRAQGAARHVRAHRVRSVRADAPAAVDHARERRPKAGSSSCTSRRATASRSSARANPAKS